MTKGRLEAFSDGVIAIIITITALILDAPDGNDFAALMTQMPLLICYAITFLMVGTHWANHHHLMQVAKHVNGKIIWANLLYLFMLSLLPVTTGWVGKSHFAMLPVSVYIFINLCETLSYILLQHTIISSHDCVILKRVVDESKKEALTIFILILALVFSFYDFLRFMSFILLIVMSCLWIIPDMRLSRVFHENKEHFKN